jgi:hypothetical protein
MNKFKNLMRGIELRNEADGLIPFQYGMAISNSNGDVSTASLGYQYTIQTTTQIRAKVLTQKFYELPVADYVPIEVGTGAWMESIKTNAEYLVGGAFSRGNISAGVGPASIAQVDVATSPINAPVMTWAMSYNYTVAEVNKALASNNWDIVAGKMKALKKLWDLGIQKVAFLGLLEDLTNYPGLYTNTSVKVDTSTIGSKISAMSAATFATFVAALLGIYYSNSNSTVLPDTFVIPTIDYIGMVTPIASGFPVISQLTYLLDAFKQATNNPNFRILPCSYGTIANHLGYGFDTKDRYVLYRHDPETIKMDLPVDMSLFNPGTLNNFQFQGVGAGQYTGAIAYRPAEICYFDHT